MTVKILLIFGVALMVALGATPVARRIAARIGWIDQPSARKIHLNPVPLLGGAAIYLACAIGLLFSDDQGFLQQAIGIIAGSTVLVAVGIWDDKRALPPYLKLVGELAAASFLLITDVRVHLGGLFVQDARLAWLIDAAITVIWVVYITNAVNYLDNMDGLSSGVTAIAALFFLVIALREGQYLVATMAAAVLGATIGFLRYNFTHASIFMGDAGTLFLGFSLAAIGIKLHFDNTNIVTWMVPIFVLGLPLFDITLVTLSRPLRGVSPFQAGKDHFSHRLVALGWTKREAVLALYVVCFVLGVLAILLTESSIALGYMIGGLVLLAAIVVFVLLERVPYTGSRVQKTEQPALLAKDQGR